MTTEAEYAQRKAEHPSPVSTLTDEQLKAEVAEAFGEMNWREWYYFLRVHALSHVEQIQKLRGSAGFPVP